MKLLVTYYNHLTDLDKQIFKILKLVPKKTTFSGRDGGRTLTYTFNTTLAIENAKKILIKKLPYNANLVFKVID